jgi:hypothetical protein
VVIYTDGACKRNPDDPGGWGVVLCSGPHRKELHGGESSTTNNRMELTAVIEALNALKTARSSCSPIASTSARHDRVDSQLEEARLENSVQEARQERRPLARAGRCRTPPPHRLALGPSIAHAESALRFTHAQREPRTCGRHHDRVGERLGRSSDSAETQRTHEWGCNGRMHEGGWRGWIAGVSVWVTGDGWMGFLPEDGSCAAGGLSASSLSPSSPPGPP